MIDPKEIQLTCMDGASKTFIISKIPAVAAREIITQYLPTAMPKVGDYKLNEALMLKLMGYVAVPHPDDPNDTARYIELKTRQLVDNQVPDWETLARLELAMIDYNCSFFKAGKTSTFFAGLGAAASRKITETLTGLLANLSTPAKQPSRN